MKSTCTINQITTNYPSCQALNGRKGSHCKSLTCTTQSLLALPGHSLHYPVTPCTTRSLLALPGHSLHYPVTPCTTQSLLALPSHSLHYPVTPCTTQFWKGNASGNDGYKTMYHCQFYEVFLPYEGTYVDI